MIPKIIEYTIIMVVVFLMLRLPAKKRGRIVLVITFLLSVFLFYFWSAQKVPEQQKLVSIHGKIVEDYYGKGHETKDIILRFDNFPEKFLYLTYFPNWKEVDTQIRMDNVITIWYEPGKSKSNLIWRIDNERKTVASFSEIAESYEGNSRLGLYMGIFFTFCFIGFLIKELYRYKRSRPLLVDAPIH
jgi:hypothetical protein